MSEVEQVDPNLTDVPPDPPQAAIGQWLTIAFPDGPRATHVEFRANGRFAATVYRRPGEPGLYWRAIAPSLSQAMEEVRALVVGMPEGRSLARLVEGE